MNHPTIRVADLREEHAQVSGIRCRGCGANPVRISWKTSDVLFHLANGSAWCAECYAEEFPQTVS
jgi:hypothetical protein